MDRESPPGMLIAAEDHALLARPGRRILAGCVLGAAIVLTLLAAAQLYAGRQALLQAATSLHSARQSLSLVSLMSRPSRLVTLRRELASADESFDTARQNLRPWEGVLGRLGWVPGLGPKLAAAGPAANTGGDATDSAVALLDGLGPVDTALAKRGAGGRIAMLAMALARSRTQFEQAAADADAARAAAAGLPVSLHNAQLDRLLSRLRSELPLLQSGTHLLAEAPSILGVGRPAHYLFAWENPAELRATGGFIGAADYMTVDAGIISHRFYGHILPHEITTATLPLPEAVYTPEDYLLFCDSNWSPDFPLSARLERWFYGEDTGKWADGVIDFVDSGIAPLLRATGPVYLPGYHQWVTSSNAQTLAQQYINGRYKGPENTGLPETIRKQFFKAVLVAMLGRLQHLPLSAMPAFLSALRELVARHDLQFYARSPALEQQIAGAGASGALRPVPGDFLMVVDDNRSYNKINPYVTETGSYAATVLSTGEIRATLTLRYALRFSPAGLEGYGPDWGRWGSKHDYQDFLRVFVPAGAQLQSLRGADLWSPRAAYGLTEFAGRFLLDAGRSNTLTIRYVIPPTALGTLSTPLYRLTVQRQAGTDMHELAVSLSLPVVGRSGAASRMVHAEISLAADARYQLRVPALRVASAALPPDHERDPYLGYPSLTDPRHPL